MKSFFNVTTLLVTALLTLSCAVHHQIPVQTQTQVLTIIKDSLVIRKDTVILEVPVEHSEAFDVQHSHLETTVAYSEARVDSTGRLSHTLVNKPYKVEKEIVYQDRKVIEYRDSVQIKEVPVEVEVPVRYVPKFYKFLLTFNIIALILIAIWLFFKFR